MTATLEELPDSNRIIAPLRLVFWGNVVCFLDIRLNHFDITNNFIGMTMILWGAILLFCVPVSNLHQKRMLFVIIVVIITTIIMFFTEVLYPLKWIQIPKPNLLFWTLVMIWMIISFAGTVSFLRCMKEYSTVLNWERAIASWQYSIRLMIYGVGISGSLLMILTICRFPFLEFHPQNPLPIRWTTEWHDDKGIQYIASRNGENLYTSEIIPSDEWFEYPKLDSSPRAGDISFGDWFAPLGDESRWVFILLLSLVAIFLILTNIHILMSLSRMIRVAKQIDTPL